MLYFIFYNCAPNRFTLQTQQKCGFRKVAKKVEPKKGVAEEIEANEILQKKDVAPPPDRPTPHPPTRSFGRLVKPFVFTIGVGTKDGAQ